jgi:hypothetical protein
VRTYKTPAHYVGGAYGLAIEPRDGRVLIGRARQIFGYDLETVTSRLSNLYFLCKTYK